MDTPQALIDAYSRWQQAGRPGQVESRWNKDAWSHRLPKYAEIIGEFPADKVGRNRGPELIGKVEGGNEAVRAFLLAMVWGYGPVGYGPFRTMRILEAPHASERLLEVAHVAQTEGGLAAFQHVATKRKSDSSYLKFLGPAFGTKFLYFVTAPIAAVETGPVMDAVVARWFRKNVPGAGISVSGWDGESYTSYLEHLRTWSKSLVQLGEAPLRLDEVEFLIFAGGADFKRNSEWTEQWTSETPLPAADLLDRLRALLSVQGNPEGRAAQLIDELEVTLESERDTDDDQEAAYV